MEELERLFLREKPSLALLAIDELDPAYAALVAKRIDSTFSHTVNILSQLEGSGLIRTRPEGRVKYLELTARGRAAVGALRAFREALRPPKLYQRRLDRIREMVFAAEGRGGQELCLGPLRRDLSRLKEDDELREAAEKLDERILGILRSKEGY